jgi:hypothetical protein
MTLSPAAIATARRNVVQRIDRFLDGLDRAGRPPNPGELHYLREALKKLDAGLHPDGEDAMLKAERINSISEDGAAITASDAMPVDELRAELRRIIQG